jgi:hypothetical protein
MAAALAYGGLPPQLFPFPHYGGGGMSESGGGGWLNGGVMAAQQQQAHAQQHAQHAYAAQQMRPMAHHPGFAGEPFAGGAHPHPFAGQGGAYAPPLYMQPAPAMPGGAYGGWEYARM